MDEVDGMSAGDRGGVGALNALIKKSKVPSSFLSFFVSQRKLFAFFQIPIICIANDRQAQKLKPLISTTFAIPFQKYVIASLSSRPCLYI
jgi:replication factor C subunit 1